MTVDLRLAFVFLVAANLIQSIHAFRLYLIVNQVSNDNYSNSRNSKNDKFLNVFFYNFNSVRTVNLRNATAVLVGGSTTRNSSTCLPSQNVLPLLDTFSLLLSTAGLSFWR